jgi:mRNA interferase MazF
MSSMSAYNFGDVILVPFPFTDQSQAKQQPAVVVSSARYNTERPDLI